MRCYLRPIEELVAAAAAAEAAAVGMVQVGEGEQGVRAAKPSDSWMTMASGR